MGFFCFYLFSSYFLFYCLNDDNIIRFHWPARFARQFSLYAKVFFFCLGQFYCSLFCFLFGKFLALFGWVSVSIQMLACVSQLSISERNLNLAIVKYRCAASNHNVLLLVVKLVRLNDYDYNHQHHHYYHRSCPGPTLSSPFPVIFNVFYSSKLYYFG